MCVLERFSPTYVENDSSIFRKKYDDFSRIWQNIAWNTNYTSCENDKWSNLCVYCDSDAYERCIRVELFAVLEYLMMVVLFDFNQLANLVDPGNAQVCA